MNLCIGANIRQLRQKAGISQEALAGVLGISVQAVSKCEFTFSIEGTVKVSVGGVENEQDVSVEDEKGSLTVYKVGGKWYMAIIPAGQTDIGM